jgi:uncharacterized membrane protein YccC
MQDTVITSAALDAHRSWRRRLRAGLPDAARMLIAAMLAYALAHALQLREAQWAVLSALITGRAQAGGTARAGVDRLIATIAGAALASAVAAARAWQVDGAVLLFAVLAPLCLLSTLRPAYRTAPIAALIVLSSGLISGTGPLGTAVLRTTEIALGSFASLAVSLLVFPRRVTAKVNDQAASILHHLAAWLRQLQSGNADGADEALREALRAELRELGVLAYTANWRRRRDDRAMRLLRVLTALHGDIGFLARAATRKSLRVDAQAADFVAVQLHIAAQLDALAGAAASGTDVPSTQELHAAIKAFATARTAADREVPLFLLRSVAVGIAHVGAVLWPQREPPQDGDAPVAAAPG